MKIKHLALLGLALMLLACAPSQAQGIRIAYVSTDSVLRALPEYKIKTKEFETYRKQLATQIENKQRQLEMKYGEYQQSAPNWRPEVLREKQRELQELDVEIQESERKAQADLQRKQNDLFSPLLEKVRKGVDEVGKAEGYNYIAQRELFLYAKPEYDITQLVIKKVTGS
jgi:outer membrane protein